MSDEHPAVWAKVPLDLLLSTVSPRAIRLYGVLAGKYADRKGRCFPSRKAIMQDLGILRFASVSEMIQELSDAGWVGVGYKSGRNGVNVYTVHSTPQRTVRKTDGTPQRTETVRPSGLSTVRHSVLGTRPKEPDPGTRLRTTTASAGEDKRLAVFVQCYEREIGMVTFGVSQQIAAILDENPSLSEEWIRDAFAEAIKNNVRKINYVRAVIENWAANGRGGKLKKETNHHGRNGTAVGGPAKWEPDANTLWLKRRAEEYEARKRAEQSAGVPGHDAEGA